MDAVPSPCMCTLCPGAGGRGGEFWLTSSLTEGEGRRGGSRSWAPPGTSTRAGVPECQTERALFSRDSNYSLESRLPGRPLTLSGPPGYREPASSELLSVHLWVSPGHPLQGDTLLGWGDYLSRVTGTTLPLSLDGPPQLNHEPREDSS